jgi:4-hydroxy-tetrahydrodipicolinate reductase
MKIAVVGALGRMGRAVLRLVRESPDLELVGASDAPGSPLVGQDIGDLAQLGTWGVALSPDVDAALLGAEVCVDFSLVAGTLAVAQAAAQQNVAWVCGTTGLEAEHLAALDHTAQWAPVLWAPNMSLGVQVLADLVREAVARLGPGFDIEIVETHHRRKVDAPSGTARRLAEAAQEGRAGLRVVSGRDGIVGARQPDELGVLALRGGDVIGDHTVFLLGDGERIELTHRASSRDLFAHGALRAARFLVDQAPGRYQLRDIIEQPAAARP